MEKSHFLQKELKRDLAEEDLERETGFDPKQLRNRKLSHFWKNGDTIFTVTIKKFKSYTWNALNPDSYKYADMEELYDYYYLNRRTFVPYFIMFISPLIFYIPSLVSRLSISRRSYYMNQLLKKRFIENNLGMNIDKKRTKCGPKAPFCVRVRTILRGFPNCVGSPQNIILLLPC